MNAYLPLIIAGLITGSLYGLAGAGVVLTYKTSGIFNFAHGAIATAAAFIFYWLHYVQQLQWMVALVVTLAIVGGGGGLLLARVARRLATMSTAHQILGLVGLVLLVQALATIKFGPITITVDQFLPLAQDSVSVFGAYVTGAQFIVLGLSVACVLVLAALFRFTRAGVEMRSVVDDPDLAAMLGTNPDRVRRLAWFIGTSFAALSGILLVPLIGADSIALTFLVVQAFGAAAVGGFSNIPLTFAGGLVIGVASSVATKWVVQIPWLSGLPSSIPFILLILVLLVLPRRKLVRVGAIRSIGAQPYRAPGVGRIAAGIVATALLALAPHFAGTNILFYTSALTMGILLLSLGLLVRISGQVSLCHAAFAAIGAVSFSQLHADHGVPWLAAMFIAGLIVVPVGALVAIPAIRLSGVYLALATLGFGILVEQLLYSQNWMFTSEIQGRVMPMPAFAESPMSFYYVVLAALVVTALAVSLIRASRLGRMLEGISDSATAMTAMGLNVNLAKTIAFGISAFFAGIAGVLFGVSRGYASGADTMFTSFSSLVLIATLGIAPFAEPWFAAVGAVGVVVPAYLHATDTPYWLNAIFGVSAVVIALQGGAPTMPERLRAVFDKLRSAKRDQRVLAPVVAMPRPQTGSRGRPSTPVAGTGSGLAVDGLSVQFGGVTAVEGLSLRAPRGQITGLIGPNGAGKTTTFNACSGLNRRYQGRVRLDGRDITRVPPAERARRGLGRTFQLSELCEGLTVRENVILGREASRAGRRLTAQFVARRMDRRADIAHASQVMQACGIEHLADRLASTLSTGQRRLVEIARSMVGPFTTILLDEPSAGLDRRETQNLGKLLRELVGKRDAGLLLVEHDMSLTMNVCDYIYVVDFGRLIFEGTPAEVAASSIVRKAYLGADGDELEPEAAMQGVGE